LALSRPTSNAALLDRRMIRLRIRMSSALLHETSRTIVAISIAGASA
jgi:hypothetical protein